MSEEDGKAKGTVESLYEAVYPSMAMLAGVQLELFTSLDANGEMSVDELALALDVDARRLGPLLYALVNAGLLRVDERRFSNSAEADRLLVRGRRRYIGERHQLWADFWSACLQTAESIRRGSPQARHDFKSMSEPELESFLKGLHTRAVEDGRSFAASADLSRCGEFLDLAGGSGGFAIGFAEVLRRVKATVVELPRVAAIARRRVSESGFGDRVRVIAADVTSGPLQGAFDVAMLRNFVQVLPEEEVAVVLAHLFAALRPGGDVYINGDIIDDNRTTPAETVAFNLVFVNLYDAGQAYTQSEYSGWLRAAGFVDVERLDDDTMRARVPE